MIMHKNIQIDSEFQALIPPLSAEERAQLEANIVADGCRDPLVVWGDTLIDGHNRYEICTRLGLPFDVVAREFDSREAVMDWMEDNQLGRRNLKPDAFTYLLGRKYNRQKKSQGGDRGNQYVARDQNDTLPTADKLAAQHGVSAPTVKRAGQFADAVDAINHAAPGFAAAVNAGEAPTRQEVVKAAAVVAKIPEAATDVALAAQFADLPQETQQEALAAIAQSEPAKEVMREAVHNHRAQGTGENEWYTPQTHLDAAYEVLGGIDLDPASSEIANKTVQAERIFTINDDGLTKEWAGRVWMNPPYAQPFIAQFVEKLASEYEAGRVTEAISLTHNYTDTQWFHRAATSCAAICFTRGRIGFLSPEGKRAAPTQGQAFFYYGTKVAEFVASFSRIGFVVEVRNA